MDEGPLLAFLGLVGIPMLGLHLFLVWVVMTAWREAEKTFALRRKLLEEREAAWRKDG